MPDAVASVAQVDTPMRQRLLIVGADAFGREVLSWALHVPEAERDWSVGGFLDSRPGILDGFGMPFGILGDPRDFQLAPEDVVLVALGDPSARREWANLMASRGARFATLVHPTVLRGLDVRIGAGSIICPRVVLTTNVRLGRHVVFNCGGGAGHDVTIGDFCTLSGGVDLTGHVRLGEGVMVGSHVSISPRSEVGEWSTIGAGSVVMGRVPPRTTVMGVPAVPVWGEGCATDGPAT